MKPPAIPLDFITALPPIYRAVIPDSFLDANGHMNMRYYLHLFDDAGDIYVAQFGLTPEFHRMHTTGGFDLEHHIHYLREVRVGDSVTLYGRLVGASPKRIHYLLFMMNETNQTLAAIFECVNSFADLSVRRTAPYPPEIYAVIQQRLAEDISLEWLAPLSGVMSATHSPV